MERDDLLRARQRAGQVETDSAEKFMIVAQLRRLNAQLAEFLHDQLIDLRRRLHLRIFVARLIADGANDWDWYDSGVVVHDDVRVTTLPRFDQAIGGKG